MTWPTTPADLMAEQEEMARRSPPAWRVRGAPISVAGCFVCFARSSTGKAGEAAWAAAVLLWGDRLIATRTLVGQVGASYEPGLLALREGPLLEAVVRALPERPDVLLVNATGRDHSRRAGLALHLGTVLDLPTVGVTHRPLVASGGWPVEERGSIAPLLLDGDVVGAWLRTQPGRRPLAVHAAWRTDAETAVALVLTTAVNTRTPAPLRLARQAARVLRARS